MKTYIQKVTAAIFAGACLWLLLQAPNARAFVLYWNPNGTTSIGGNGTWDTATQEWSGASAQSSTLLAWPVSGVLGGSNCAACFCAGPTGSANQGTFTVTLTNSINCAGIFNGDLNPGPCSITLSGTGSGALNLLNALCAFETYNGITTINLPITGPGVVNIENSGSTYLNATNTFTGGIALGNNEGSPAFTGILYYNNNSSFGTGPIAATNTGGAIGALVQETGASGTVITNAWKIALTNGGINLALTDAGAVATFSGPWTLASNLNIGTGSTAQSDVVILSGVMSGAGAVNKFNVNTLRLSGANTYTGSTSVSNGTLQLGANGGIPSGSGKGNVTVAAVSGTNGTLDVNGFSGSINGLSGAGIIDNTSGNAGTLSIGNNNATSTFTGSITSSGTGQFNITKAGTGAITFNGTGAGYSGNTTINAGTYIVANGNSLIPYTSPVTVATGATLNLDGNSETVGGLNGGGSVVSNSSLILDGANSEQNFAAYSCFFGTIDKGTLTKNGTHAMSLRQTNMYNTNLTFNYSGGVLSVGAGPDRLPPSYGLNVPSGGLFQLDANNQTVSSLNGSGSINLGGGTLTVNATSGSFYNGTIENSELPGSSTAAGHGLRGYYYTNIDFTGLGVVRDDANVLFTNFTTPGELPPALPSTNYISIRWLGQIQTTVAGTYTFTTTSDDGQRLWVAGTNLVDDWASHGATAKSSNIVLAANTRYDIVMEYMNITGGASTKLTWTPPGDTVSTVIPTDFLYLPGAGNLVVAGNSSVALSTTGGTTNTYTGGTIIGNGGTLDASGDTALGQGNVYVTNNAVLSLDSGSAMTYISSNADLIMSGGSLPLGLNYAGTDTIHAFSTNGGATYLPTGTYGGIGSGATHQISLITGGGFLNVTAIPASISLTSSSGSTVYGSSITFTSTVTGSGPTPTGTVTFYDGASAIGQASLSAGQATLTISDFQVANSPHTVTAVYSGDSKYISVTSSALTQTVTPMQVAPATLAVSNKVYDSTVNASIIVSNCTLSGVLTNDTNNVRIASATATFSDKNIGTSKTVTFTNFVLSGSLASDYTVSPNTGTTTANITAVGLAISNVTANSRPYNTTSNATLNTGSAMLVTVLGSDNVVLNSGGAVANFTNAAVGANKAVIASGFAISGTDATNYNFSQPTGLTASITQASTTNMAGSTANPSNPGQVVDFTSTISPIAPGAGTPTGNVTFVTNGVLFSVTGLSGGSTISAGTSNLYLGTNTIIVAYGGDSNFIGSTNTFTQFVGLSAPGALSISRAGGNVVLNWSGSFVLQSAPVVNGTNSGFTDLPGPVTTGPYTNTNSARETFFRLRN